MRGRVQMLPRGAAIRKHIITHRDLLALPDRVAQLEVKRRRGCLLANGREVMLLRREVVLRKQNRGQSR